MSCLLNRPPLKVPSLLVTNYTGNYTFSGILKLIQGERCGGRDRRHDLREGMKILSRIVDSGFRLICCPLRGKMSVPSLW